MSLLSFIIPTLNEESNIYKLLESIRLNMGSKHTYEIIVVDNGSTDNTVLIAEKYAEVYIVPNRTIGYLRNFGVNKSKSKILVFLDGDVYLTSKWIENLPNTINLLNNNHLIITGSRCGISEQPCFIERVWFKPLLNEKANYINSGHLIVTRYLFDIIGGFSENLVTDEDYDFSKRAQELGASLLNDPRLEVVHEGYPKNISSFVKREIWHGKDDFRSIKHVITSKVSILTIMYLLLHSMIFLSFFFNNCFLNIIYLTIILTFICFLSALVKYKKPISVVLFNTMIYYFYFAGRSIALIIFINHKIKRVLVR